jgi:tRNA(His) 5'-end guanylyltransferase
MIRLDGKAFHTYTKSLKKPFDNDLFDDIDSAIMAMLPEIQGAVFAYTQSDEISILLTDFATPNTDAWFDGNLQKMCSVSASIITAEFNKLRWQRNIITMDDVGDCYRHGCNPSAYFDARVFTIPDRVEVMNYLIWRNQDCARNSVSMVAQSLFSHKELHGKNTQDKHDMMHSEGVNWATDYTDGQKNGRLIVKEEFKTKPIWGEANIAEVEAGEVVRTKWVSKGAWKFTENKDKLLAMIPKYES